MNVGHVRGTGGVDPTPDRAESAKRSDARDAKAPVVDKASISPESKATFTVVSELTARVKQERDVRTDRMDAARERLERGDLDTAEAFRATAERLLDEE